MISTHQCSWKPSSRSDFRVRFACQQHRTASRLWLPVSLALVVTAIFLPPGSAEEFPFASCHFEYEPAQPLTATLNLQISAPALNAAEWIIFDPVPPELEQQHLELMGIEVVGSNAKGKADHELSPEHRIVCLTRIPANIASLKSSVNVQARYKLTTSARYLRSGAARVAVAPLSVGETKVYTTESETIDFSSSPFQSWLKSKHLSRRAGETDIRFAWRVFNAIRQQYSYYYAADQNRHISKLCESNATDCGGLSWLFVGAMRANGIPARSLVGRWLKPDNENDNGSTHGQCHVKAEFFANGIGWVPIELSGAVSAKERGALDFFGRFAGDFVTLHVDTDLMINSIYFGVSNIRNMQSPLFWVTGAGTVKGYTAQTTWQTRSRKTALK